MTPGQTILVVDDDDDFRTALCEVLSQAGYPVEQAASGEAALLRLEGETPGLVLLDLKMPGIDGWGVIERMRAEPRWAAIPVLILSAYGYEWEAELLGVQGYIPKADVKLDGILARVRNAAGDPPLRH
jgi:CheY-like chemotaxis protein